MGVSVIVQNVIYKHSILVTPGTKKFQNSPSNIPAELIGGICAAVMAIIIVAFIIYAYRRKILNARKKENQNAYFQHSADGDDSVTVVTSVTEATNVTTISAPSKTHDIKGANQFDYVKMPSDSVSISGRSIRH